VTVLTTTGGAIAIGHALARMSDVDLSWLRPAPRAGDWSLADDTLRFLAAIVQVVRPEHVLEFGSGVSTRLLSRVCSHLERPCRITSVDHDPVYFRSGEREAASVEDGTKAAFHLAPLVARMCAGRPMPQYFLPELGGSLADIILIDGPPEALGGREGMLYQAMDFARAGTLILLDDAERPLERAALTHWEENLEDAILIYRLPGFKKGLAAIEVLRPVLQCELDLHRIRLSLEEIARLIPEGQSFLLADNGEWDLTACPPELRPLPFPAIEGQYAGPPPDDEIAVRELERMRHAGARLFVVAWPAFWWLDFYQGFREHLQLHYPVIARNERLVAFDLRE
jgi:predicted O-methyltransferase YrrM